MIYLKKERNTYVQNFAARRISYKIVEIELGDAFSDRFKCKDAFPVRARLVRCLYDE